MLNWQWAPFAALSGAEVYALLAVRSEVFVMEQNCPFLDADDFDQQAWHLLGWDESQRKLAAYCRVIAPGIKYAEPSIGRVLTAPSYRRHGLGRLLMAEAIARTTALHPGHGIRIGAQQRLEKFYQDFGFRTVSEVYIEDGIPHIEMLRAMP